MEQGFQCAFAEPALEESGALRPPDEKNTLLPDTLKEEGRLAWAQDVLQDLPSAAWRHTRHLASGHSWVTCRKSKAAIDTVFSAVAVMYPLS